jgi:hypothetical protein
VSLRLPASADRPEEIVLDERRRAVVMLLRRAPTCSTSNLPMPSGTVVGSTSDPRVAGGTSAAREMPATRM